MALTNFIDKQTTVTTAWLNLVDALQNAVSASPSSKAVTIAQPTAAIALTLANADTFDGIKINWTQSASNPQTGLRLTGSFNGDIQGVNINNGSAGTFGGVFGYAASNNLGHAVVLGINSSGYSGSRVTRGPAGEMAWLLVGGSIPFSVGLGSGPGSQTQVLGLFPDGSVSLGDNGATPYLTTNSTGNGQIKTPTGGGAGSSALDINALAGQFGLRIFAPNTANSSFGLDVAAGTSASDICFQALSANSLTTFFIVRGDGTSKFPSVSTTASAANAFLDNANSNNLLRSTSSIRYKTDVEDLWSEIADTVLALRPVWYRSKAEADRKDWSWFGLIAEEVAKIEPRLVHWTRDIITPAREDEAGVEIPEIRGDWRPDAVQYERVTVLLLSVVGRLCKALQKAGIYDAAANREFGPGTANFSDPVRAGLGSDSTGIGGAPTQDLGAGKSAVDGTAS